MIESQLQRLGVSAGVYRFGEQVLAGLADRFAEIDRTAEANQYKVIAAMQQNRVSAPCFAATTGYGYDDVGRDTLEKVYASCFHTEAALVRPQITCGTHALTVALSANLLPGDELLSPVGKPYDTLEEVIGIRPSVCSLKEYGVSYRQVDLRPDGTFDYDAIRAACQREAARFAGAARVAIRTGDACLLQLDLSGRSWLTDAGDGDLPCGEIYIAPVETASQGSVFFEDLYWEGTHYRDVTLTVTDGEISGSSCPEVARRFAAMPRAERTVCELGLGMNPHVTELCGYPLLDEKMAGTFHIAVGANTMFGGENRATDHGDFVGRGEVEVLARDTTGYWRVKPE